MVMTWGWCHIFSHGLRHYLCLIVRVVVPIAINWDIYLIIFGIQYTYPIFKQTHLVASGIAIRTKNEINPMTQCDPWYPLSQSLAQRASFDLLYSTESCGSMSILHTLTHERPASPATSSPNFANTRTNKSSQMFSGSRSRYLVAYGFNQLEKTVVRVLYIQ